MLLEATPERTKFSWDSQNLMKCLKGLWSHKAAAAKYIFVPTPCLEMSISSSGETHKDHWVTIAFVLARDKFKTGSSEDLHFTE